MLINPRPNILNITPYKAGSSVTGNNKRVIKLSSNETPLGPSPHAIEAHGQQANQLFRYPDPSADQLRESIANCYQLNKQKIICGAGSDEIISLLCFAFAGPGDEVIHSQHGFLMYPISTLAAGATPVVADETNLTTNIDAILGKVTPKTKIVFIANPNNPTGSFITRDPIIELRKQLRDDILLVLDGAYAEYVSEADYTAGADIVDMGENTVMTRTFSKIYGLAALRIGWAYCPESIADIYNRIRGPFNISSPAIAAGAAAMNDVAFTEHTKMFNDQWRDWLSNELQAFGLHVYPSAANFLLVKFPPGKKSASDANRYLLQHGIIGRMVENYGLPDCMRFTVGLEDENQQLVDALKNFLA